MLPDVERKHNFRIDAPRTIPDSRANPMIKSLHVTNFRCYRELDLKNLGLVNVVVGKNASGKTALLESIFLPGGHPEVAFRLRAWRSVQAVHLATSQSDYEALWNDLFFGFDRSKTIKISMQGTPENTRTVTIKYAEEGSMSLFPRPDDAKSDSRLFTPIVFETKASGDKVHELRPIIQKDGTLQFVGQTVHQLASFFPSLAGINASDLAQQFSKLRIDKMEKVFCDALTKIFPNISELSVEASSGLLNSIYCSEPTIKNRKIPLGLVSHGIQRLAALLLGISSQAGGVFLIDEVENGFHHSILSDVWSALIDTCKEYNVQLFASTYSEECINALLPILKQDAERFRLLRTEERQSGEHNVKVFRGDEFEAALETGVDVRG